MIPSPPPPSPPAGHPGAYARIQLLLVVWVAASSLVRGGVGLSFPGAREVPFGGGVVPPPAELLVRLTGASMYVALAFLASRRWPVWDQPARAAARHLGTLAALHGAAALANALLVRGGVDPPYGATFYVHKTFEYVVFALFAHGLLYGEHAQAGERAALRLRAGVADSTAARLGAQMRALRMEWSPRFLTGALASIGDLLARDPAGARRLLVAVSGVLRQTLALLRTERVRLEREVALVREVLRVESLRRPGLAVAWEVDEGALELPAPQMALLAMVHRVLEGAPLADPLRLRITVAVDEDVVVLRVDAFGAVVAGGRTGDGIRRTSIAPGGVRLELRCAAPGDSMEGAGEGRPAVHDSDRSVSGARTTPAPRVAPVGRMLEGGTYAALVLLYGTLAAFTAGRELGEGRVDLHAPAWVYVAGSALYAALWWGSFAATARVLAARFPFRRRHWPRALALHAGAALGVGLLNAVALFPFQWFAVQGGSISVGLRTYWGWGNLAVYVPLAGIAHGFVFAREYGAQRLSELRLRSALAESELRRTRAELQALKAELNPHFLFNALNTVASLIHADVGAARRVVTHLSALLQRVLESASLQEVSVEEEVEFLRLYLEIEQARFGDALRMNYRLEPGALRARVPHLLVQPLVENAVKHGLRPRGGAGQVTLSAERVGDFLHLAVTDDGVGLDHASGAEGTGSGLAHVRERLRQLYGDDQAFELAAAPAGGASARIRIPFFETPRHALSGAVP